MVSRIGFFLQIIPLALFGGDYYFTYSLFSNNLVVSFEKLQVSKKMTATDTKPVLFFEIQNDKKALNEKEFVYIYKDEIIELILENRAFIKSVSKIDSANITEHSIIRTLPTLINIDFKEDFAIIGIYEQTI
jgi:hypothetical protein